MKLFVWPVRAAGALTATAVVLVGRPAPAAACTSSYGFQPRLHFGSDFLTRAHTGGIGAVFGGQCSGSLSLSASFVLALVAIATATVFASRLLQRADGPAGDAYLTLLGLPTGSAPPVAPPAAPAQDRPEPPPGQE